MIKLLSLTIVTLAISMASARPAPHLGNVHQSSDNDLIDLKDLTANVDVLDSVSKRWHEDGGHNVYQSSENDLIDLKGLTANVIALDSISKRWHGEGGHNVYQSSDNDLIDLKDLTANVDVLDSISKRWHEEGGHNVYQSSDNDLIDLKDLTANIDILDSVSKRWHKEEGHNVYESSDNDLIDLKDLTANVDILDSVSKRSVTQKEDNDLIDAKNLKLDVLALDSIHRRSDIDAAFDILRRANYNVDSLSLTKRGNSDMWQFDEGDHTCYCAKKKSCDNGSSTPSGTSSAKSFKPVVTASSSTAPHVYAPTSTQAPSPPPTTTPTSTSHHHHHHHHEEETTSTSTTTSHVYKPKPTHKAPPSCPSGWSRASQGDVIQSSDNDLIDLKNLTLNIDILNSEGSKTSSKSVPASDKPTCGGSYCCYKSEKSGGNVEQSSDNDVLDAKNANIGISLLNNIL